ncbi:MAG: BatA domain-containing protein [Ignavibacteria bacterium]|nr:BatA domain-containing protein [Ignavibacteria bacterium]MBT8381963.1 BatA domain-containing protein [Ignavibacteria bacterium]
MTFLNPAILFGLLAASIPILIHLLNLRKLKKIEFSTLQFLKELQKNKIRKIKLKQWLLLALRVLIILLIVTAFARPTLEGVSVGGTTSAAKTTAVFILDDTFSMSVIDQQGSYFNNAKQTIKEILNQMQEGDEAGLILVSHQPEEINHTTNLERFKSELDDIQISFISNELNSAIVKAAKLIGTSRNFNKEIYLLTDFQKGRLTTQENVTNLNELLNEQVRFYAFDFSGREILNVGISDLKLNTQIFEKNKPVKFEAEVTNYSSTSINNLVVSLFIEDERSAQQSLNLNPGETKTANLEAPTKSSGLIEAFVEIEEDDILKDNKRYTSIYIPEKIDVLVLNDAIENGRFINLAIRSASVDGFFNVTNRNVNQAGAIQLQNYDAVIINSSSLKNISKKIQEFLSQGKGIVIFPSSNGTVEILNSSLAELNIPASNGIVKIEGRNTMEFDEIDFHHPLFENIFLEKEKKQVESPKINSYHKINVTENGKSIIKLIDGSSFLSEYSTNGGKIFLFNSSADLAWNDFPLKSIFAPLLNKIVLYISSNKSVNEEQFAGEKINVNVSNRTLPQIKILRPDSKEDLVNMNEIISSNFLTYNSTELVGNYKFFSGEKLLNSVCVNTDPLESVVEYLSENDFVNYLKGIKFKGTFLMIDNDENPVQQILQARFGSELWRYFLIAAIFIALIEMAIARNAKKEIAELKG